MFPYVIYPLLDKFIRRIFFQKDTSGDYRKILLELLKDPSKRSAKAGKGKSNDFQSIDSPRSSLAKYENVDLPGYEQPAVYKEDIIVRILFLVVTVLIDSFSSCSNKEQ